eukprot:TRINITY_DN3187_c0_g1_i2.p1 TRINITY_DN3187_c0_g1~~TRINITY_DN3187_c0_g1_i2.p1  ORF type:complete len:716 (+),score=171.52 TRINITY_DN3187_c0_g1_i2:35-2182(+)
MNFEPQPIEAGIEPIFRPAIDNEETEEQMAIDDFENFLKNYQYSNDYIYREQVTNNLQQQKYYLKVYMEDLMNYKEELANKLTTKPSDYLYYFEKALNRFVMDRFSSQEREYPFQILINYRRLNIGFRDLTSSSVNSLIQLHGIVISAARVKPKARILTVRCRTCGDIQHLPIPYGFGKTVLPKRCANTATIDSSSGRSTCERNPYQVIPRMCEYIDVQTIKLQEFPENVPAGELPQNVLITLDRNLCNIVQPGQRIAICGLYGAFSRGNKDSEFIRSSYIRGIGIDHLDKLEDVTSFTTEQINEFREYAAKRNVIRDIKEKIAPQIVGHDSIKMAIASMLFGGTRKVFSDGLRVRGDINILLLGDPSTAKSQFLKFTHHVAPISVYTSGKSSSSAGLTATVIRDSASGEFVLESGALVLADCGVVCIDEFEKTSVETIVAIHEAMEQQTISIAKAGITTVLNSRCSILAAANPKYGQFVEDKTFEDQVVFQSTILSRFDIIFVIRDVVNIKKDTEIAAQVLRSHTNLGQRSINDDENDTVFLKNYIAFARSMIAPVISAEASDKLQRFYTTIRSGDSKFPLSIRQLEALVRITESFARMELKAEANGDHADKAIDLFKASTMNNSSLETVKESQGLDVKEAAQLKTIKMKLVNSLQTGVKISVSQLMKIHQAFPRKIVKIGINQLISEGTFERISKSGSVNVDLRKRNYVRRMR